MKKMSAICAGVLMSLSLLVSLPAFGESGVNVEDRMTVIVKVFEAPVPIRAVFTGSKCEISAPMTHGYAKPGETFRIKVIGDKDIIVRCNGEKGITISRD